MWVLSLSREDPLEEACNPLQHSCLENPMDRGAWWSTVHGVLQSQTGLKQLSMHTCSLIKWSIGRCTSRVLHELH